MAHENNNGSELMEVCGMEGEPSSPVTKAEFNYFVRRVKVFHLRPMQQKIDEIHLSVKGLDSIRRFIVVAAACVTAIISALMAIMSFLHNMGWSF